MYFKNYVSEMTVPFPDDLTTKSTMCKIAVTSQKTDWLHLLHAADRISNLLLFASKLYTKYLIIAKY